MHRPHDRRLIRRVLTAPINDYLAGLNACLTPFTVPAVVAIGVSFALSWWIYVPIHELAHAFGCLWAGGAVTRLEIAPIYGAALLQRFFPFVAVGSEYAGQLTGFDTHGSDLTYLATDALPFVLTVLVGIPLLRSVAAGRGGRVWSCMKFGAAIPVAYAPFISLTGDYYEMGSILLSHAVALWSPSFPVSRWRSDDVFKLVDQLFRSASPFSAGDVAGVLTSFLIGSCLAVATYAAGGLAARFFVRSTSLPA